VGVDQLAEQLIDAALPRRDAEPVNRRSIQVLDEWEAQDATDDPEGIARRQAEFEEFKREMNQPGSQPTVLTPGFFTHEDARVIFLIAFAP
jgi:hypothetical protein